MRPGAAENGQTEKAGCLLKVGSRPWVPGRSDGLLGAGGVLFPIRANSGSEEGHEGQLPTPTCLPAIAPGGVGAPLHLLSQGLLPSGPLQP